MPGPSARILSPMNGDTVLAASVPVTVSYANFPNPAVNLNCSVGGQADAAEAVTGDGVHSGTATNVPVGTQTAITATAANGTLHQVDNVTVVDRADRLPVPIDPIPRLEGDELSRKIRKVKGSSPGAAYVVCQIIEVNARVGTAAVLEAGAATVDGTRKWSVDFDITPRPEPHIQYVARAHAYDKNMQLLGSQSMPIRK